jgi:two-component system NtrC family sensor kinase
MRPRFASRRLSLKSQLIWSYLVILGTGGLATSLVGSWIVSSTIMMQARRAVDHDFATARTAYEQQVHTLRLAVEFGASGAPVQQYLGRGDGEGAARYLDGIRRSAGFDFLGLAGPDGGVFLSVPQDRPPVDISATAIYRAALSTVTAAGTERLTVRPAGLDAIAILAAAPVIVADGRTAGILYGGVLLDGNFTLVDRVWNLLYSGDRFPDIDRGSVTIFSGDVRIATTVRTAEGARAIGTRAPAEVRDAVLTGGRIWLGRTFVVRDWHISEYAPISDYRGRVVGMLAVGILESTYTAIRNRVILSFFGIATLGFLLILGITYYIIRNITRPLGEMVAATRSITAGDFHQEVQTDSPGEIALLAASFNAMLKSLRQMKSDLEEWARTLEEKVKQRTHELAEMQARVAQSERLASLGMLAAGVAHEVNNPLGAILALTTLTAEDLPKGDPNAENLAEVVRQAERCRDIVKGLLQFSRQSKGKLEPVDLNEVLRDTLSLVGRQAIFFNVEVVRDLAPELPPVRADRSQMQQVFLNILMNAVQAMDERGTISISTRHDAETEAVEVTIADTGRGIPPEQIGRVFDPFFTTKESSHGTGLGLSIAYGIVTTHGGSIAVRSEVAKGTAFVVHLPVLAQTEAQSAGAARIGNSR